MRRWRKTAMLRSAGVVMLNPLAGGWAVAQPPSAPVERIDLSSGGTPAEVRGVSPSLSGDGRYVAFSSSANNLVAGDTNGRVDPRDVFVRDRAAGTTERVSVATDGAQAEDGASDSASISADGRYVAFESRASNLVPHDTNRAPDIFVRDRALRQTTRVSVRSDGHQVDGVSLTPAISSDGRFVAFESVSATLRPAYGGLSIYVHDRRTGRTTSVGGTWGATDGNASISAHGRFVAFERLAGGRTSVMVADRETRRTVRVDVSSGGRAANASSGGPAISANGRYVAFVSSAGNLVSNDRNGGRDVFVRDLRRGTTIRASIRPNGRPLGRCPRVDVDGERYVAPCADEPTMSAGGRFVAFTSATRRFDIGRGGAFVFVRDLRRGATFPVSDVGWDSPAISGDARAVVFVGEGVFVRTLGL